MSLLLLGIIAEHALLTFESELQLIQTAGLTAIVQTSESDISREAAVVLAYGEQIKRVHQETTLIPIRYGTVLADETEVKQHLFNQAEQYHKRLIVLNDCEEMGIRLTIAPLNAKPTVATVKSGHDYLLARKQAYALPEQIETQAALLNKALLGLYREYCAELSLFNGQRTYLLSYLVARTELALFRERLQHISHHIIMNGFISGPWPPYNFAN